MKKCIVSALCLGALLFGGLTGCVSRATPPADRRVTVAEDLGRDLVITDVRCGKVASPYCTFQANVVNTTGSDLGIEWKIVWLDARGMAIEDPGAGVWNRQMLPARGIQSLRTTATRMEAADMMFHVRALRQ